MGDVEFRRARAEDAAWGAELVLETLYGFGTYQTGLGDPRRALSAMQAYFRLPGNRFSYQFTYCAIANGNPAGLLLLFPGTNFSDLMLGTTLQMFKVYKLGEVIQFIRRAVILRDEEDVQKDEMYIAHLAVVKNYRRSGIGRQLLDLAEILTVKAKLKKLSLMADLDNTSAIALYQKHGFQTTRKFMHPHQIPLTGSPGYLKMVKEIN